MAQTKIDPLTGLPTGGPIDPLTGLPIVEKQRAITTSTGMTLAAGDYSSFADYGVSPSPYFDMEEERAKRQSTSEKWGRGLAKAGVTATGAFLEGTAGTLLGLGDWVASGFDDFDESMSRNAIGVMFDNINENMRESMPNYYTKEEQAMQGTLGGMWTANFWADKVANGGAYTLGTIASMFATGGYGAVGGALKLTGAAGRMSKALAGYRAFKATKAGASVREGLRKGAQLHNNLNRIGKAAGGLEAGAMMSMAESAVEARETGKLVQEQLTEEMKKRKFAEQQVLDMENGQQTFGSWEDVQLSVEELRQVELQSQEAEGAAFYGNMAVLMPTNLLMFGKMAAGFRSGVGFNAITRNTAKESAKDAAFKELAETLPQGIRQTYKVGRAIKPIAQNAVAEGYQEGMQYAISQGLSDYELRKFEDSGSGDLVEALLEGGSRRTLKEAFPDVVTRASKSWSDREAREQIIIGALVGMLGGGRSAVVEGRAKKKNTESVLNMLNSDTFYNLAAKGENLNFNAATVKGMIQAEKDGDVAKFERLQSELVTENVLHHLRMGSLDFFKERWNDAKKLSDEEFKAFVGIDPEFQFTDEYNKEKVVDGILKHADKVEEGYKMIEGLFNRQGTTGLPKLLMGKKGRKTEKEILEDNEIYKNFLLHNYARLESIDADVNSTLDLLETLVPASKELRQSIQQYKRARFGDVNINSEGKETITMPEGNKLNKVIEELQKRSSELDGPLRVAYDVQLAKLTQLVQDRNTAALAFDNLLRDDKKRDLFISRTKAKVRAAKQAKVDQLADKAIEETKLPTELSAKLKALENEGISEEAKTKIRDEIKSRDKQVAEKETEFGYMKKSEVEALENLSPIDELARKNHLEKRTQEEPINVDTNDQAKKAKERALARQREEQAKRRAENRATQQPGPPTEPPAQEGPTDQSPPPPNEGQTLEQLTRQQEQGPDAVMNTITGGNGEFMLDENGKVIVDDFGNPKPGPGQNSHTFNGEPIITHRNMLQNPEVGAGTVVELRAVEDDWWVRNRMRPEYKGQEVKYTPIYIYIDGNAVGILQSENSAMRTAVVEAGGKAITTTIKGKQANNMVSAITDDGKVFLSNAYEVLGDTPVGVVRFSKDSANLKVLDVGNAKGKISEAELERINEQVVSRIEKLNNLTFGQVVFLFKDPNGQWDFKVGHTAKLNDAEISKALELIQKVSEQEAYEQLMDLVGFNQVTLELAEAISNNSGFIRISSSYTNDGDRIIEIAAPAWLDKNGEGMVVSVSSKNLAELMKQRAAGNTSNLIDARLMSIEDKNAFGGLIKLREQDQEGKVTYKGAGFNMFKQHMDQAQRLIDELPTLVEQALAKKKRQVDVGRLTTEANYFQELANQSRPMTADEKLGLSGHEGVIAVDAINVGGGIMRDIGLTLSQAYSVDGKPVATNNKPVAPIAKPAPAQQAPTRPEGPTAPPPGAIIITSLEELNEQSQSQEKKKTPEGPPPGAKIITSLEELNEESNKPAEEKNSSSTRSIDDLADDADTPFRLGEAEVKGQLSEAQAKQWLKDRNIPVEFYDMAKQVGSSTAHGYMKNAMVYLWKNAEVGTEYHEAFHFVFRMMLNDTQRAQLYKEAEAEYGKPTKEEIENAKRGQSEMSDQAAYELALEEKMAEEFRDYVFTAQETAKTLPGKIRKFFQDLWNYIKSIFSNSIGVNQLFSLIEANNLPAKFERNFDRFKEDTAFRIVDSPFAKDPVRKQEVISTISNQFIKNYMELVDDESTSNEEVSYSVLQMLGTSSQNKGVLANYFLRHAFKDKNNNKISDNDFNVLKSIIDKVQTLSGEEKNAARKELADTAKSLGISFGVPIESNELPIDTKQMSEQRLGAIAKVFYDIYINWYDVNDPRLGNITSYGWRDSVVEDLGKYGYTIQIGEEFLEAEMDNETEDGNFNEDQEVDYDKIYNITHFENDPSKKISAEVKKLFGKMINDTPNSLGFLTFADIQSTYKAAVHATVGLESFEEMVGAIQHAAKYHKDLVPIGEYLATQVTANEAAMVRSLLGQEYANHRFLLEEYSDEGTSAKIVDSDRRSASLAYMSQWRVESKQTDMPREGALFKVNPDGTVEINNNAIDGKTRLTHLNEAARRYSELPATDVEGRGDALNDMLWYMSMAFSNNKDLSRARVIEYLNENPSDRGAFGANVFYLASKAFKIVKDAGRVDGVELKARPENFFETEGSTIKQIAERAATYRLPTAMSFISGRGKSIYPYNTGSHFSHLVKEVVEGKDSKFVEKMFQDESFNMFGMKEYQALLLDMIESGVATIESFSLDTIKNEEEDLNQEYKEIGMRNSMILRMNAYLNNGNDYAYYPISIQETRGRMDFIKLPKFHNTKALQNAGIARKTKQDIITGIIVRDLVKLNNDPSLEKNLGSGFHLKGIENSVLNNGLKLSDVVETALQNPTSKLGVEFFEQIGKMANNYLNTTFEQHVKEYSEQVDNFNLFNKDKNGKLDKSKTRLDAKGLEKFQSKEDFLISYLFDDLVAKVELANMLRGGATQAKDVTKFYKRMGLVNTPGTRLMLQGEFRGDKSFGFFEKVIQGTINPVNLTDKEHDKIAKNIRKEAERQGATKAEAKALEKAYRIDNQVADKTDGQAFISPHMFRAIEQGLGRWTPEHEEKWKQFLKDGSWTFTYTPNYKFYQEDLRLVAGQIKPEMNKNSYVVLTPDLVQGTDLLQQMYNRMMGEGNYAGMGVVHLINTTSATKGWASEPITVSADKADFSGLQTIEQDGSKFLMPQIINESDKVRTRMNRQIRKNIISAVDPNSEYYIGGKKMKGSEVLDEYHKLIESILVEENAKLFKRMGYDKMLANPNDVEARINFLKEIRKVILNNANRDGNVDSNMQKQLQLVEKDIVDFAVPAAFPAYQRRYQNLIFALFRNNVHRIDVGGKELVQVASPGRFNINGELRELRHIDVREGENTIRHAEVLVSQDMLDKLGLEEGETGLAYRIPHQGYSSTVPIKVVGVLPRSFSKTIVVPGNITVQTGSDFDIDKLFVMLRDRAREGAGVEKRNRILDILEGITLSKNHFLDTIRPLTQDTLDELASRPEIYKEAMYTFDHPLTELLVESNAKASQTLVGTFANALSGFSVAVHGGDPNSSSGRGLRIHPQKVFTLRKNGEDYHLDIIQGISKVTNRLANAGTTESLSAALDAFSNLIHLSLNENKHTASAKVFLQHIGMDEETIIYFMAQPLVREFVKRVEDSGMGAFKIFAELGTALRIPKKVISAFKNNEAYAKEPMTQTHGEIDYAELERIVKEDDMTSDAARNGFINFIRAYYAGDELSKVYKAITPDTVDGMGDLAEIEAYLDNLSDLKMRGENSLVGYRRIRDILEGDSYPLARAYYNAIKQSVKMSSELFLGGTPAVQNFKEIFKQATGKTRLDAKDHRFIDRMLFYHMLTKEGSPLGDFLSKDKVKALLANRTESLYTRIQEVIKTNPLLAENTFLAKIAEPSNSNDGRARVKGIEIDNLEKMTPELREQTLTAFHDLLYNPQLYTDDVTQQGVIKRLGEALVLNSIVASGLAPTYGSYFNSIPIEFFMGIEKNGVTLMDYFSQEFKKAKDDVSYFNDFVFDFARNFGTRSIGNQPLIPRLSKNMFVSHDNKSFWTPKFPGVLDNYTPPVFATFKDYGRSIDQVRLYMWNGAAYVEVQTLGINNQIIELNLRNNDGQISNASIWTKNDQAPMNGMAKIKGRNKSILLNARTGVTSMQSGSDARLASLVAVTTKETQKKNCE